MEKLLSYYFLEIKDPRVTGRCMHLLSDILMISLLTYLTGGTDYQNMTVLESLDIEDAVVSIDAIGTQTKISEQINQGGHYFLSVKNNQKRLLEDLAHAFKVDKGIQYEDEPDSHHARIENRKCNISPASIFPLKETMSAWKMYRPSSK